MRSIPVCWNKTLAKLGFRRNTNKKRYQGLSGRRVLFEQLERREMLAGDTYVVNTLTDVADYGGANDWSLREALAHAANDGQADKDVIEFAPTLYSGTIALDAALGELTIDSDVEIHGLGASELTIDAQENSRVFNVATGVEATISELTITGGGSVTYGGGVYNLGDLTLDQVAIVDNHTIIENTGANSGGGVYVVGGGSLHLLNSTVEGNQARWGGGINVSLTGAGVLEISGSTVSHNYGFGRDASNNVLTGLGGGLLLSADATATGAATIVNSTFSGNRSTAGAGMSIRQADTVATLVNVTVTDNHTLDEYGDPLSGGYAGGIQSWAPSGNPTVTLHNTIVAGNTSAHAYYPDVWGDISGTVADPSSYNILGVNHTAATGTSVSGLVDAVDGNQVGSQTTPIDPGLAPLADNGGVTKSHALLPGSLALDAGDNAAATDTIDQREYSRFVDLSGTGSGVVDIGAYEQGLVVSTEVDESDGDYSAGDLSLREALALAAVLPNKNEIEFDAVLAGAPLLLTAGQLTVASDVEIIGLGTDQLTIDAQGNSRVFEVASGVEATLSGLTITGGGSVTQGAGIRNYGNLTLEEVAIVGNETTLLGGGISGGGIYSTNTGGTLDASLRLINSTVDSNRSKYSGGIRVDVQAEGVLEIIGSTISNNRALDDNDDGAGGGALLSSGAGAPVISIVNSTFSGNEAQVSGGLRIVGADTRVMIVNSTIYDNHADVDPSAYGGGMTVQNAEVTLHNTILAGNTSGNANYPDVWGNISGTVADPSSYNILGVQHTAASGSSLSGLVNDPRDGTGDGLGNGVGDQSNPVDPMLAPLGDYGGPTLTHALLPASVAIDFGAEFGSLPVLAISSSAFSDQRGFPRAAGEAMDPGGNEFQTGFLDETVISPVANGNDPRWFQARQAFVENEQFTAPLTPPGGWVRVAASHPDVQVAVTINTGGSARIDWIPLGKVIPSHENNDPSTMTVAGPIADVLPQLQAVTLTFTSSIDVPTGNLQFDTPNFNLHIEFMGGPYELEPGLWSYLPSLGSTIGRFVYPNELLDHEVQGDFTGDGFAETALIDQQGQGLIFLQHSDPGPSGRSLTYAGRLGNGEGAWEEVHVGDFNGDGRDDLLARNGLGDYWTLALSDGTQFNTTTLVNRAVTDPDGSHPAVKGNWGDVLVGDFDADGSDELVGRTVSDNSLGKWQVIQFDEQLGAQVEEWSGSFLGSQFQQDDDKIFVGDVNLDGRDDLIGYDADSGAAGPWYVSLSLDPADAPEKFDIGRDYGHWFDDYYIDGDLTADGPVRRILEEFEDVYNNVELELYAGFLKGVDATADTQAGNPWDQAALLVDRLDNYGFDAQIAIGTVMAPWETVRDWIGAPNDLLDPVDPQLNVANLIAQTIDKDAVVVSGSDQVRFQHAWVEVVAPTPNGLMAITLNPSWKFKARNGISPDVAPGESLLSVNLNAVAPSIREASIHDYLVDPGQHSTLTFYEDAIQKYLIANHAGTSIADITYDGPIVHKRFDQFGGVAGGFGSGVVHYDSNESDSNDEIIRFDKLGLTVDPSGTSLLADSGAATAWTHQVHVDFVVNDPGSSRDGLALLSHNIVVPEFSQAAIIAFVDGQTPKLTVGATTIPATSDLLAGERLTIVAHATVPAASHLRASTPLGTEYLATRTIQPDAVLAIGIEALQHSESSIAEVRAAMLTAATSADTAGTDVAAEDIDDLLGLLASEYWMELSRGDAILEHATYATTIARTANIAFVVADGGNSYRESSDAPYQIIPNNITLDVQFQGEGIRHWNLDAADTTFALSSFYSSDLESSVIERVVGIPAISTTRGLRNASQRSLGVLSDGSPAPADDSYYVITKLADDGVFPLLSRLRIDEVVDDGTAAPTFTYIGTVDFAEDPLEPYLGEHAYYSTKGEIESLLLSGDVGTTIIVPKYVSQADAAIGSVFTGLALDGSGHIWRALQSLDQGDGAPINGGGSATNDPPPATQLPSEGSDSGHVVTGDPVDVVSGNLLRADTDISFPNLGQSLDLSRRYNSQSEFSISGLSTPQKLDVGFGIGWTHSFSDRLIIDRTDGDGGSTHPDLIWLTSTGERHVLTWSGSQYEVPSKLFGTFQEVGANDYEYLDRDGTEYQFHTIAGANAGQVRAVLARKVDRNGDGFLVTYNASEPTEISTVEDVHTTAAGVDDRKLVFAYDASHNIDTVSKYALDDSETSVLVGVWNYDYETIDSAVYLSEVFSPTDAYILADLPAGATPSTKYEYYGASDPTPYLGLMKKITEPNGEYHAYEYYLNKRVFRVRDKGDIDSGGKGGSESFSYNIVRGVTEYKDENDNVETYIYQQNGLTTQQIHADRTRMTYSWGAVGGADEYLMKSMTDEVGATETYDYYEPTEVLADPWKAWELESTTSKRFIDPANSAAILGQDGVVTTYDYSRPEISAGNVNPDKAHIHNIKSIAVASPTPVTTTFEYDPEGRLTQVQTSHDTKVETTTFAHFTSAPGAEYLLGLVQTQTDARDIDAVFDYDPAGNVRSAAINNKPASEFTYDHNGNLTETIDPENVITQAAYDVLGRLRESTLVGDAPLTTVLKYDASGRLLTTIDALNRISTIAYDNRGRISSLTGPDSSTVKFDYDDLGNPIAQTDELGRVTRFIYDSRSRLILTMHPDGATDRLRYDGVGRITAVVDALGHETVFRYDAAGRLRETTNALDEATTNKWDVRGNLVETIDGEGNVSQFVYDGLNRVVATRVLSQANSTANRESLATTPLTTAPVFLSTIDYDENGNVKCTVVYDVKALAALGTPPTELLADDPRPLIATFPALVQVTDTDFDEFNRPTVTTFVNGEPGGTSSMVETRYDDTGRVEFQYDEAGTPTEYRYDDYGRLKEVRLSDPDAKDTTLTTSPTTSYEYDEVGNIIAITDARGNASVRAYDSRDRLIAITNAEGNTSRFIYDDAGQAIATIDALGRSSYSRYDSRGRVVLARSADPDGSGTASTPQSRYEYDDVGNVLTTTDPRGNIRDFEYDELNRLRVETNYADTIADDATATYKGFAVLSGTRILGNEGLASEGLGGDRATVAADDANSSAKVAWHFKNLAAGEYRVFITWPEDAADTADLDTSADVEIRVGATVVYSGTIDQTDFQEDLVVDYEGAWLAWEKLCDSVPVDMPETDLTVTLTGSQGKTIIADAIRIERVSETAYGYDHNGQLDHIANTFGNETSYDYDGLRRVARESAPDPDDDGPLASPAIEYEYDGYGNVTSINELADASNPLSIYRETHRDYDFRNRLELETADAGTGGLGIQTKYEYDPAGNVTYVHNAFGSADEVVSRITYDNLNRQTEVIRDVEASNSNIRTHENQKTTYAYDPVGNLEQTTAFADGDGTPTTVTRNVYDKVNRVTQLDRDYDGTQQATTTFTYDAVGNLLFELDPAGILTTYAYDRNNRLTDTVLPDPGVAGEAAPETHYRYDAIGNLIASANGLQETTTYLYDSAGRLLASTAPDGTETYSSYDSEGNLLSVTDPNQNTTVYAYDALNRMVTDTIFKTTADQPEDALSRHYTYNDRGELRRVVDRNERRRDFGYDTLGRLVREDWVNAPPALDDAYSQTDHVVGYLEWEYDNLGRVVAAGNVPMESARYTHAVQESVDAHWDTYSYDNLGRVISQSNYRGDADGLVGPATTWLDVNEYPRVAQGFVYDIVSSLPTNGFSSTTHTLNVGTDGSPMSVVGVTSYTTDRLGRLQRIADAAQTTTASDAKQIDLAYRLNGQLEHIDRTAATGFSFETSFGYDGAGRLESIDHVRNASVSPAPFASFSYGYDDASRITDYDWAFNDPSIAETSTRDLLFDANGQLTQQTAAVNSALTPTVDGYDYDDNGNREDDGMVPAAARNQIASDAEYDYFYDNEGNLIRRVSRIPATAGETTEYVWDYRNRLVEVREFGSEAFNFIELGNSLQGHTAFPNPQSPEISADGASLTLTDSEARAIDLGAPYVVTPETVVEFDFWSDDLGIGNGIGFDSDLGDMEDFRLLKLAGTSDWPTWIDDPDGIDTYQYRDGVKHYRLRIGAFYEAVAAYYQDETTGQPLFGPQKYLIFVSNANGTAGYDNPVASSTFSNVRLYEDADGPDAGLNDITRYSYGADDLRVSKTTQKDVSPDVVIDDFRDYVLSGYDVASTSGGAHAISSDGSTLTLGGGAIALALELPQSYAVTRNTVLEFDFQSTTEGLLHGIGFEYRTSSTGGPIESKPLDTNLAIKLDGSATYMKHAVTPLYTQSALRHYKIRVADFYDDTRLRPYDYLVFLNGYDSGDTNDSSFSNVSIYEDDEYIDADHMSSAPENALEVDFTGQTLQTYAPNGNHNDLFSATGDAITLTNYTMKALDLETLFGNKYDITADSIIEFDFASTGGIFAPYDTGAGRHVGLAFENQISQWENDTTLRKVFDLFGWAAGPSALATHDSFDDPPVPDYLDSLNEIGGTYGDPVHYRIRLGAFYNDVNELGEKKYLVFLLDDFDHYTVNSGTGIPSVTFSNISIYEQPGSTAVASGPVEIEHYVYSGGQRVLTLADDATVKHRYLYGPGVDNLLVDEVFDAAGEQVAQTLWAVNDHLGTVHELIDGDTHDLVEHRDYDAFGNITDVRDGLGNSKAGLADALVTDVAFAGREWDKDAELYYNRARWYDAKLGRFVSEDPIGFAGGDANLYRYAGNGPTNRIDPSGYSQETPDTSLNHRAFAALGFDNSLYASPESFGFSQSDLDGLTRDQRLLEEVAGTTLEVEFLVLNSPAIKELNRAIANLEKEIRELKEQVSTFERVSSPGFDYAERYRQRLASTAETLRIVRGRRPSLAAAVRNGINNRLYGEEIVNYSYDPDLNIGPTTTLGVLEANPRFQGSLQIGFGLLEGTEAAALFVAPVPGARIFGTFVGLNAADNVATGAIQVWTGQFQQSFKQRGTTSLLVYAGVDPDTAALIGGGVDIGANTASTLLVLGIPRGSGRVITGGTHNLGAGEAGNFGIPLRSLSTRNIRVTDRGIAVVEAHLQRFGNWGHNNAMLTRLRRIANGDLKPTQVDLDFYAHELREFVRFRNAGAPSGSAFRRLSDEAAEGFYRAAHEAALQEYGIPLGDELNRLYTPEAQGFIFFRE